jgi:5-methylcytosine-specific restriction endonuclease McrA
VGAGVQVNRKRKRGQNRHPNIDHNIPVSAGGSDKEENLLVTCTGCNVVKDAWWPEQISLVGGRVNHPNIALQHLHAFNARVRH